MAISGALPGIVNEIATEFYEAPVVQIKNAVNTPQTNGVFLSPLFYSLPTSHLQTGSALLARRIQYYNSSLSAGQVQMNQFVSGVEKKIQSPTNIALLAAGGYFLRTAQLGIKMEEAAQVSKTIFLGATKWKISSVTISTLLAAGCGVDGGAFDQKLRRDGGPDPTRDAGIVDKDNDGAPAEIDCDDSNPHIFPLVGKGGVVEIRESTTICPGLYNGFTLLVPAKTKNITLTGKDVTLEGHIEGQERPVAAQAIRVIDSDNIQILGFKIQYYEEPVGAPGMVRVENSRKVRLNGLDITANFGNWPVRLVSSEDTNVEKVNTHTHSDRALKAENCKRTKVEGCNFNSEKPYDYQPAFGLLYFDGGVDNTLLSCQLYMGQGCGLLVKDSVGFQGIENIIHGNTRSGIFLDNANNGYYRNNKVNDNGSGAQGSSDVGFGLYLQRGSKSNTFFQNNFTGNVPGPYGVREVDASLGDNTFIENTPQP